MDFTPEQDSFYTVNRKREEIEIPIKQMASPPILPTDSPESSMKDLTRYGWGILTLFVLVLGFKAFSFQTFHRGVSSTVESVKWTISNLQNRTKTAAAFIEYRRELKTRLVFVKEFSPSYLSLSRPKLPNGISALQRKLLAFGELGRQETINKWIDFAQYGKGVSKTVEEIVNGSIKGKELIASNLNDFYSRIKNFYSTGAYEALHSGSRFIANANGEINKLLVSQVATSKDELIIATSTENTSDKPLELPYSQIIWTRTFIPVTLTSYNGGIEPIRSKINESIWLFVDLADGWTSDIALAWSSFYDSIFGISNENLKEQLKKEIMAELKKESTISVEESDAKSMFGSSGIVVMKPSGSTTIDLRAVKKLEQSFSDRVIVNFDNGGQSGTVQPIFRDRAGQQYLFLITPVKK